ncbi:hypothetical protein A3C34_02455 [Candidatus Amesbacteria bacterium RIFCSPHIGHO2_02_FULL_48_21]|uniref:Septum formation initiator n=4 Tax=Candidatus Amesiibacteriota TaxID=1752730 RepID=A0A1F4Z910_9BACT|nr:MAG: Septum formation initiator [Candidatus Amesbacteria bacterium GW2011_GWA2_47_11]KKU93773.1 MAG: Septum formation initiator [Candidatus Amesbacteria bacterium GW2011_GWC1_48_10]KKW00167.1 MAG: Septum formation initiator [Candidatus Amesbacteria bacterium GW2011_GWA1_48_9]OGC90012.1 MAG: hypothetical protein A2V48_01245 [Candidatus Amesbacteria bacterium RBG_19FT_COMBO_48_16]OGC96220.1 MAG: hypothetical protein A3C34_02455 [Candidatus Amesbacteria bacterium RIFCSPHIGHO2_02_FULL_48_21]OGD
MKKMKWKPLVIAILGMVMAVRTGLNVYRLWRTGDSVKEARRNLVEATAESERLQKQLLEVKSPEWVEKEARERLGYGRPGETILVLPEQESSRETELGAQEQNIPNWKKWWKLYVRI